MIERSKIKKLSDQPIARRRGPSLPQKDYSEQFSSVPKTKAIFRDQKRHAIQFIRSHPVILGAVAWLTDEDIVLELAGRQVSIIVQKEDFLRPDESGNRETLRQAYDLLWCTLESNELPGVVSQLGGAWVFRLDAIRCLGNMNRQKSPAFPRMHNKFLVGCDYIRMDDIDEHAEHGIVAPKSVWTGSYNFTYNAISSFENAIIIEDQRVAMAYAKEWAQIFALSEPLNWSVDWVSPEYWVGT